MGKNQQGFALMEMLIAVILLSILIAASAAMVASAMNGLSNESLKSEVGILRDNIRTAFSSRVDYDGLNTNVVSDLRLAPATLANLSGPGGSTLSVTAEGPSNRFFAIRFDSFQDVDEARSACIGLIPSSSSGWHSFIVNGNTYTPMEFKPASDQCQSATSMALVGQ